MKLLILNMFTTSKLRKSIFVYLLILSTLMEAQTISNTLDVIGLTSSQPANVAFSVRKLSTSYNGPLFRLLVGSYYYDVYPDASSDHQISMTSKISSSVVSFGDPISPATNANLSSLSATMAYVAIWYDQSGNGNNLSQSITGSQPKIIESSSIITENGRPFVYWDGIPRKLELNNVLNTNGQVIVVNKFNTDGFLLGHLSSYFWHSNPSYLFDPSYASNSIQNGIIFQNSNYKASVNLTTYNTDLGINSVAPLFPAVETSWDNIGVDRVFHHSYIGSGWSEILSFPSQLNQPLRAGVETDQSTYFGITLNPSYSTEITLSTPSAQLTSNCTGFAPSTPTTFDVTGSNLASTVTVSATTGFQISTSQNSGYASSLSLTPDGSGTVSSTLYVRLTASSGGGISGTITASSAWANTQTTTVNSTTVAPPAFSLTGPFNICAEASYLVALATPNSYNGWSSSDANVFSVNSTGYITTVAPGTASITYTDACGQSTSQTVTVQTSAPSLPITDTRVAFKFNGSPQGPTLSGSTINYIGYDGYTYFSQTRPTNVGFYNANIQSGTDAGCPNRFYIFTCATCNN
jgi:hypothetical protein